MNAASAIIKFPSDKLQVVSVSKSGSIVDFWAQEPSFSNTIGEIKLEGIVLTPGFKGSSGKILTINFKGKNPGIGVLNIFSSSVLANDGTGTNILAGVSDASFNIIELPIKEPEIIKIEDLRPIDENLIVEDTDVCEPDSIITSSTHPGIIWRRENTASFSWDLPEGTLASKIDFNKTPLSDPEIINSPAIVEKRYENLEDGIWYFHLSLQNNNGWSESEHFKIKIDHTPPSIEAKEIKRIDLTDPRLILNLNVFDKTSCLKNIEISINDEIIDYEKLENGDIRLSTIEPGEHELVITAYDKAGNKNQKFLNIVVEALEAPEIISFPSEIKIGETLIIEGKTIPNGNVEAKITSKKNNFLLKQEFQSASGKFTFKENNLKKGIMFASFRVKDVRGAQSKWSQPIEIEVKGNSMIDFYSIVSSLGFEMALILGLLIIVVIIIITRALTLRKIKRELGL